MRGQIIRGNVSIGKVLLVKNYTLVFNLFNFSVSVSKSVYGNVVPFAI